ncbi:hypothetical protein N0V83_008540 [Neocucurbitaria cava]|uniref:Letm1 RBD domain-containing protein n=1 Tax=Neocucurbitaria cava TaxID=798079 RepID=A0A9W9CJU8_9PLEO|nr:hypothetical protein N0V83_008540 [Neocucurbitaria cava]
MYTFNLLSLTRTEITTAMKPRPTFSTTFVVPMRSNLVLSNSNPACRRNQQIRAIAPALSYHIWREASRSTVRDGHKERGTRGVWTTTRYASTAAAPAPGQKSSSYGPMPFPPPLPTRGAQTAKTAKSNNVPTTKHAKPTPTTTTLPTKLSPRTSHAPTSSVPAKRPSESTTQGHQVTARARENLNPPRFTYAPDLSVPARKANQNTASYLWAAGRAYVAFYKAGISHVRQTLSLAKKLRSRALKDGAAAGGGSKKDISEVLTRAEWQVVLRSRKDALRLPAFGALVLLLGEWLPLVVIWITPVIPEACRIPKQVERELNKTEKARHERLRRISLDAVRIMADERRTPGAALVEEQERDGGREDKAVRDAARAVEHMTHYDLLIASARYNCHSRIFDYLHLTPPKPLLRRRVGKMLEYLRKDDRLIERDGGVAGLGKEEVRRACVERGIDVLGKGRAS